MSTTLINETTIPGIVSSLLGAIVFAVVLFMFRNTIARWVKYWIPKLESKTPHINFQTETSQIDGLWGTTVTISNAGNEPAYNVYAFMTERFALGGHFKIRSLGASGVRRPVLGINDSLIFDGVDMPIGGCNVTTEQELWIEFENSAGVAFRTVSIPRSPRNDDERVYPPKVIRHRLEQWPDLDVEGDHHEWRRYQKGARDVYGLHGWREWLRQRALAVRRLLRPTLNPAPNEGRFRGWLANKLERTQ